MNASQITLAIPTRGQLNVNVVARLEQIHAAHPDLRPTLFRAGHLAVDSVRNDIVHAFLQTDSQALLMLDDDVVPPVDVLRLAELDTDIAAIPYLTFRNKVPAPCTYLRTGADSITLRRPVWGETGVVECDAMGTGCMLIHRRVLEHPEFRPPFMLGVNTLGIVTSSEDITFCLRARDHGFRIMADYRSGIAEHILNGVGLLSLHDIYADAYAAKRREEAMAVL